MMSIMIIRDAERPELTKLRNLLSGAIDLGFDLDVVAEEKLFGPGYGGPARCRVALEEDSIRGVAVTSGSAIRLIAVEDPFRLRGIGSALLDDALSAIRLVSKSARIAAAPGNYLVPGIPAGARDSIRFFRNRGFIETSRSIDMKADLLEASAPGSLAEISVERVSELDESLERFLSTEFGPAIAWEIGHGLVSDPAVVRIARSRDTILGFTACEINNAGLGTFGPQGVAEAHRGRGIGTLLLRHSLADLRELGFTHARIPWVSSTDYYEKTCGATVAGEFIVMGRALEE